MHRFRRHMPTLIFTLASSVALAQDMTDLRTSMDTTLISTGDVAAPTKAPATTRITNTAANVGPTGIAQGNEARQVAPMTREVVQQQAVVSSITAQNGGSSEFHDFIRDTTGKSLPIFGAEFFSNTPSTFAPLQNIPVPADYALSAGDEILIRSWGSVDIDFRATLDRNGLINIPTIGSIVLAGVKVSEAESVVRGAIGKLYKGVTVSVTFGQLRAITVYVVGQARRPGTYTVSSLSTLVTALFASGGPNANGSMRQVQVKRGSKVVAELDLYEFIGKGNKSNDVKLQDGDTIFIPPAIGFVALIGKVNRPAIFELRTPTDTIASILDYAGGLPIVADPRRAFLESIDPQLQQPRKVAQFALDTAGLAKTLKNGDMLSITSITPEFSNAVTLRGNVDQAIRAPFFEGMRISDLIPSRDYLVTRASLLRRNNAMLPASGGAEFRDSGTSLAGRIGSSADDVNWDYAVVERYGRNDLTVGLVSFNLGKMLADPASADNLCLERGDVVTIFSQSDVRVPLNKRKVFVRVEGEVNVPGVYQMGQGETLITLIARAGGPTSNAYLYGTEFYREQVRREQQANIDKVTRRLEAQMQSKQAQRALNISVTSSADVASTELKRQSELQVNRDSLNRIRELRSSGRISFKLDPTDRSFNMLPPLRLENGDQLIIPSKPDFVHVYGAVNQEASILWQPGSTISKYLADAGLTSEADLDGVFVLRADGSVLARDTSAWLFSSITAKEVMPGDSIVIPEIGAKETAWTKFTSGAKDWAQIFSGFGLGAAAVKTLR